MRYTIIELLGKLASPGTTEVIELIKTYADDPDHHVRSLVKRVLGRLNATPLL
jgi:HEAT repeat protein